MAGKLKHHFEEALGKALQEEREEKEKADAQAQTRRMWLEELVKCVRWVEERVARHEDAYLEWFGMPDAPGSYDHGLTVERLEDVIDQLRRVQTITLAQAPPPPKKTRGKGRRGEA
jgi:hypothetical protein